jgi:hypothetical protein
VTYHDFESETDGCVTIRERDSMSQKGMQAQTPIEEYSWTKTVEGTAAGKPDSRLQKLSKIEKKTISN